MNAEEKRNILEVDKLIEEIISLRKKNTYFEIGVILAAVAVGIGFAKLIL